MKTILPIVAACLLVTHAVGGPRKHRPIGGSKQQRSLMESAKLRSQFRNDLEGFYDEHVKNQLDLRHGEIVHLNMFCATVTQVVGEHTALMRTTLQPFSRTLHFAVTNIATAKLVDDQSLRVTVQRSGKYEYITVTGASRTIPAYVLAEGIGFVEFKAAVREGFDFLGYVERRLSEKRR